LIIILNVVSKNFTIALLTLQEKPLFKKLQKLLEKNLDFKECPKFQKYLLAKQILLMD